VCGTDNTVKSELVGMKIVTALLVRVNMEVWN
jgi:hypothetical protein